MATARKTNRNKSQVSGHSNEMVDSDAGTIIRDVFINPEIYA